ncbi:MAG: SDR family oxidoreductase [Pseudomonadota bacterium]
MSDGLRFFIFGAGFSARHAAQRLIANGHQVVGTTRNKEKFDSLKAIGIEPVLFNDETTLFELADQIVSTTHLLISIAPPRKQSDGQIDPVLAQLGDGLRDAMPDLQWVGYLSTVGVYGNHDGAWIDEETQCKPVSQRSKNRVLAEQAWQEWCAKSEIPLAILRLSGIYGPGRNAFRTIEAGKSRRLVKKGQVFNRIHVDDIAQAVQLAAEKKSEGVFNITDNEPAPPQDVVTYAHDLMGREPPPEMDFETAELSPMARSFYGENKRVSNRKSVEELGMIYRYYDYRMALKSMWFDHKW